MEHNYNNLHLQGTELEQRKMVHNQIPVRFNPFRTLGNLVSGFITLAIGAMVLNTVTSNLRKEGLM